MGPLGWRLGSGVWPVQIVPPERLGEELVACVRRIGAPATRLDARRWESGAYRPVPTIIEAACMIYTRNGVADIAHARADQRNLRQTTQAIRAEIDEARAAGAKIVLFVTGIPGAGKTLCGLNAAFGDEAWRGTFLTGNPTLVHVLREALARDACSGKGDIGLARRRMEGVIQQLPRFRNHYVVARDECPAERVVVIDEAQRCWSADYAVRKTRDKPVRLTDSEPGHLLEIVGRHGGFAAIICLVGSGQEIHDGEGGLAEWGNALRTRPEWRAIAAPDAAGVGDPRRHLGALPGLRAQAMLHLDVPVRQIRSTAAAAWVDAVLRGDADEAALIAETACGVPFFVVRDVAVLRSALRGLARGPGAPDCSRVPARRGCARKDWARNCRTWMRVPWHTGFSIIFRPMCARPTRWNRWRRSSPVRALSLTMSGCVGTRTWCARTGRGWHAISPARNGRSCAAARRLPIS